ncbi:MAG: YIP1 family protein [Candidatus Aenigmarchaeota archaeon]|nr:YIP1 family protein [Candidatus Aenigmarchaeota archaeon]
MALSWKERIQLLFSSPAAFFDGIKQETTIRPALKLFLVGALVYAALSYVSFPLYLNSILATLPPGSGAMAGFLSLFTLLLFPLMIVGVFAISGLTHVFAVRLGGKRGFPRTFNAIAYGSLPTLFLGWLFFALPWWLGWTVSLLVSLWSLIIEIWGLSRLHEVSKLRALLFLLLPVIVVTVIAVAVAALFVIASMAAPGGAGPLPLYT